MGDPSGYISLVKLAVTLGMDTDEVRKKVKRREFPKPITLFNGIEYFEMDKVRDLLKVHKALGIYQNTEPNETDRTRAIEAIKKGAKRMQTDTRSQERHKVDPLLSVKDVTASLGLGESTIWQWVREGKFPKPLKLSKTLTRWKAVDVQSWIDAQTPVTKA